MLHLSFSTFAFDNKARLATPGGDGGAMAPSFFWVAKRKKGNKGKEERASKQKLLKGCHQDQNIIVLAILERLEFENFSCRPTMVADNTFQCSMFAGSAKVNIKSCFLTYIPNLPHWPGDFHIYHVYTHYCTVCNF